MPCLPILLIIVILLLVILLLINKIFFGVKKNEFMATMKQQRSWVLFSVRACARERKKKASTHNKSHVNYVWSFSYIDEKWDENYYSDLIYMLITRSNGFNGFK